MELNRRVKNLEDKAKFKENKSRGLLVLEPGEDEQVKLQEYEAEHGVPPVAIFEIVYGRKDYETIKYT